MRLDAYIPDKRLRAIISRFVISEQPDASTYKVFPSTGPVWGFQYSGQLSVVDAQQTALLSIAGITGLADRYRVFSNSAGIGTILVYFTETGLSQLTKCPIGHFFNQSISLEHLFNRNKVDEITDRLCIAKNDIQRISIIEQFLLTQLRGSEPDKLVAAAARLIRQNEGNIQIGQLNHILYSSASVLERRFKHVIGTTPKKFASLVRINKVIEELKANKPPLSICYDYNFFDQAHFIKEFKRYTGDTPEDFRRLHK